MNSIRFGFSRLNRNTANAALLTGILGIAMGLLPLSAQADTLTRTTSFEYDAAGQRTKEVIEPGDAQNCLQSSYTYNDYGNRTSVSSIYCAGAVAPATNSATTARSSTDNTGIDGRFVVSSSNALGHTEAKAYDSKWGSLTSLIGPNGLTTTWQYDNLGRKTKEVRADGTSTTWAYKRCTETGADCPVTVGPATITWVSIEQSWTVNLAVNSPEKRHYFDTLNRVVRIQTQGFDGAGPAPKIVQDTEYNALGQVARQSNWYVLNGNAVWTSFTYDVLGRTISQSQPDPAATTSGGIATTSFTYNALTSTVTNAKGQIKTTTKNAQGQVAVVTDALGSTVSYSYDALGRLIQTNAAGSITSMGYDSRGNKTSMTDPAMGSWIYSYNVFGELVSQRDSLGQVTTMAYDALGRMTQRIEPDLISEWSYDKKFDTTICGLSKGKLCEARSNNGYNRVHTYDTVGRPSITDTVLDSVAAPARVSESFDLNTGRVNSKTWPTGYQASYTYTPLGYLLSVAGGGAGAVSYTVQAMNAQGQITQYRTGNQTGKQITTVKTFDAQTQRLTGQTATLDGQATGNVLNQSYSYDALGNLMTRGDNSPGVGTQENFSYDSLNRLSTATILGGAVSPPSTVEVQYDPRGNISYKSDVGRYWYDATRPSRMTNVTLERAPGATQALTGTRSLSYAFDDYNAGAQLVNGTTTMGNGNLSYTVSHDPVHNVHNVRYESYTSFNLPSQITYSNFAANTNTCLPGFTLSAGSCVQITTTTNPASPGYTCPAGQTRSGAICTATTSATPNYACATGTLSGSNCLVQSTSTYPATQTCGGVLPLAMGTSAKTSATVQVAGKCTYSCRLGGSLSGTMCTKTTTTTTAASIASYSCSVGATLSGTSCLATSPAAVSYSCPAGQTQSGSNCIQTSTQTVAPGSSNASDRTLSFIYGPEHQRIKQNVVLTGNGTSRYFAGNVWYLNGEDSLGLLYEKEVRANGTIENKHYVSAGGVVFAEFISRSGTFNGLPATSTNYFNHDQLGSISAITNELGAVTERLAYDPWGKRRYINTTPGLPDTLDALVGQSTDRGYTMHEHLDEVGIIHMNGRIYDPLIGRFMSADPYVTDPYDLQSFNRYAYVLNNPLRYTDPTGHQSQGEGDGDGDGSNNNNPGSDSTPGTTTLPTREITGRYYGGPQGDGGRGNTSVAVGMPVAAMTPIGPVPFVLVPVEVTWVRIPTPGWFSRGTSAVMRTVVRPVVVTLLAPVIRFEWAQQAINALSVGEEKADDGKNKQRNKRPSNNSDQNAQVNDAARDEKLSDRDRDKLGREVESLSRDFGEDLGYHEIRDIARQIKNGTYF
jgi:RHS repeat-associated protein